MSTILLRRGTAAQWATANPILDPGEAGFETDTGKLKIGDGTTVWNSLAYATVLPSDARLSDARTPTAHTHAAADVTSGTLDVSRLPVGAGAAQVAAGNHAHTGVYDPAGTAAATVAAHEADTTAVHGIADTSQLVLTSDGRLSDARTPTAHTHGAADVASGVLDAARLPATVVYTDADATFDGSSVRNVAILVPDGSGSQGVFGVLTDDPITFRAALFGADGGAGVLLIVDAAQTVIGSLYPVNDGTSVRWRFEQFLGAAMRVSGAAAIADDDFVTNAQLSGARWVYGDGSDGNATISGTTTLTRDMYYDTLTVTGTLNTAGYRVHCRTLCDVQNGGIIQNNGGNASGSTAGTAGAAGTLAGGTAGGNGGTAAGTAGTNATSALGGRGGAGGNGSGGAGAASGTVTAPTAVSGGARQITMTTGALLGSTYGRLNGGSGGGGGGGDGTAGGGGGGGGGLVLICARQLRQRSGSTIRALGGNGANAAAGNRGGGGGGGGGVVLLTYDVLVENAGTTSVAGGTKGLKAGTGTDGADGAVGLVLRMLNR